MPRLSNSSRDKKLVRFYIPLQPANAEEPVWSIIRKLADKIGEQLTTHLRAIADENPTLRASSIGWTSTRRRMAERAKAVQESFEERQKDTSEALNEPADILATCASRSPLPCTRKKTTWTKSPLLSIICSRY